MKMRHPQWPPRRCSRLRQTHDLVLIEGAAIAHDLPGADIFHLEQALLMQEPQCFSAGVVCIGVKRGQLEVLLRSKPVRGRFQAFYQGGVCALLTQRCRRAAELVYLAFEQPRQPRALEVVVDVRLRLEAQLVVFVQQGLHAHSCINGLCLRFEWNLLSHTLSPLAMLPVENGQYDAAERFTHLKHFLPVVIALGTVATATFGVRVAVLVGIALLMTVGVYGLVAGIVKLDDLGLHLQRSASAFTRRIGGAILGFAPWLMKTLSVVGTAAMFMVGGGILVHGIPPVHHAIAQAAAASGMLGGVVSLGLNVLFGIASGALALLGVRVIDKMRGKQS